MKTQASRSIGIGNHKPLRVVHVATQAVPFVNDSLKKGLSDVAGRMPAALTSLGIKSSLVLPLFQETRAIIQKKGLKLEEVHALRIRLGQERREAVIHRLDSPLEPSYPVYLVEHEEFYGHDRRYGMPNDLKRFAFLARAAMGLQRALKTAPDIFECHDWHTALIPVYLHRLVSQENPLFKASDTFFNNTRCVMVVHDFAYTGEFAEPSYHEAGLGWEMRLPGYAEFYDRLNLLKAGLYRAHRSYARTPGYIQSVAEGTYGPRKFDGVVKERFEKGVLVGLCPKDKVWGPDRDLTPALAVRGAKHVLAVYRSVVERPFPDMEQAQQTSPEVSYFVLTPREKLDSTNQKARELFDKLSESDQELVERAILAGETDRFLHVREAKDMENIIALLRLKPSGEFGERMHQEGLSWFLEFFHPWDLDRLLSIQIPVSRCKELLKADPDLQSKGKISLYEAMRRSEGNTESTLDHVIEVFRILKRFFEAPRMSDEKLAQELDSISEFIGEESLANATPEFRQFFEVYNYLSQEENRRYFRAFLAGVLLHDIGKPIKHDTHSVDGAKLFSKLKEASGFFSPKELDFVSKIILHHSIFGDAFALREQNPDDILEILDLYEDRKMQNLAAKCLFLVGIADMIAVRKLALHEIERVRDVYEAVIFSKSREELKIKLERIGFGEASKGINRWNFFVVSKGKRDATKVQHESMRKEEAGSATGELEDFCRPLVAAENQHLVKRIKRSRSKKKREALQRQLDRKVADKAMGYKAYLGQIEDIRKINFVKNQLNARLRARLLIWLIEHHKAHGFKNYSFEFSRNKDRSQEEMAILVSLLEEFDLKKITENLQFEYDHEEALMEISIKV